MRSRGCRMRGAPQNGLIKPFLILCQYLLFRTTSDSVIGDVKRVVVSGTGIHSIPSVEWAI